MRRLLIFYIIFYIIIDILSYTMISAYVDIERYNKFKEINALRGISSNKILNLLIADYVLKYEKLLKK